MLILGLDFETTGTDVKQDRFIETGAVLWDTDLRVPVLLESFYTWEDGLVLTEEVIAVHGLGKPILSKWGIGYHESLGRIDRMVSMADVVAGHNINEFDWPLLGSEYTRQKMNAPKKLILDTMTDLPYDERMKTRKLTHIAAEHGFLNPFVHRAVFDVLTMFKIIDQYRDRLPEIIALAQEPTVILQSMTSFAEKELAKARGYHWKGETKQWLKRLKKSQVQKEIDEAPFRVKIITEQ